MAKSKAYLYKGVEIHWNCAPELISLDEVPLNDIIHFPGGLRDYLDSHLDKTKIIGEEILSADDCVLGVSYLLKEFFPEEMFPKLGCFPETLLPRTCQQYAPQNA